MFGFSAMIHRRGAEDAKEEEQESLRFLCVLRASAVSFL
jgi:hypothetical protein